MHIIYIITFWFVCLFGMYFVLLENFSHIWRRHHYRWKAANFDLCSALMAIEQWGFFTYCDRGLPFIMVISEDPWHSHLLLIVCSGAVTPCFNDFGMSRLGFEKPTLRGERYNRLRHRGSYFALYEYMT